MVSKDCCCGVVAFLPTAFTSDWRIDEERNRANIRVLMNKGVNCIQSTGSAGEFYAIDLKQHEQMVRIVAEETRGKACSIVGCGAFATEDAINRARIAEYYGIDAIILVSPSYFPANTTEVVRFFDDISRACPKIGLLHYNTVLSKRLLDGDDYRELQKVPGVIGSKQPPAVNIQGFAEIVEKAPNMAHMVTDDMFISGMMHGATGVDSVIAVTRPELVLGAYELCIRGKWKDAARLQEIMWKVSRLTNCAPGLEARYSDVAIDKAVVNAAGLIQDGDPKPPYMPLSEEDMRMLRDNYAAIDDMLAKAGISCACMGDESRTTAAG